MLFSNTQLFSLHLKKFVVCGLAHQQWWMTWKTSEVQSGFNNPKDIGCIWRGFFPPSKNLFSVQFFFYHLIQKILQISLTLQTCLPISPFLKSSHSAHPISERWPNKFFGILLSFKVWHGWFKLNAWLSCCLKV